MWKSIIYKEWLKVRWFLIGFAVLGLLTVGNIILKVQHDILFNEANNFWYLILFQSYTFYGVNGGIFKYTLLLIGLGTGVAQFIPEIMSKRIKLSFHLPINENKMLIMMLCFGLLSILLIYAIMYAMFAGLSYYFLPAEIVQAANISITPWFLAGLASYFLVAFVILEPIMMYRGFYLVVLYFFISLYIEYSVPGGYSPLNWKLSILTVMTSVTLLFSAYRFRKGEM